MIEPPECPECHRPLQRDRDNCIYCGYRLNEGEKEALAASLDDDSMRENVEAAEAILGSSAGASMSPTAKLIAKVIIVALSLAAVLFLSWVSLWNPVVITGALLLFSFPIWQAISRL